jgi:hypothetical protein
VTRKGTAVVRVGDVRVRVAVVVGVVVAAVVVGVVLLSGGGGGGAEPAGDRLAEALSYVPSSADGVAQFSVEGGDPQGVALRRLARTFPAARFGAGQVRAAVQGLGLDPDEDVPELVDGPVVAWGPAGAIVSLGSSITALRLELGPVLRAGVTAAVVGRSGDAVRRVLDRVADRRGGKWYLRGGGVAGVEGADVILGRDAAAVDAAIEVHRGGGGLTRRVFEERLGPLAHTAALIRAVANARAVVAPRAAGVKWVDALREGSLALSVEKPGLKLRVHLATDPAQLTDADLPIAPGAEAPRPAPGDRPIYAGVRDVGQSIKVFDAAKDQLQLPFLDTIKNALRTLDSVKRPLRTFGRIDVDALIGQLTGTTTITEEARPNTYALRSEMQDGAPLRTALNRLAAVPDFALRLARVDLNVRRSGDAYIITQSKNPILKVAVLGNTLVIANDQAASLRAIAARAPEPATTPGALAAHADGTAVQDELIRRFDLPALSRIVLGGFGDLDASARAERTGLDLTAALALNNG